MSQRQILYEISIVDTVEKLKFPSAPLTLGSIEWSLYKKVDEATPSLHFILSLIQHIVWPNFVLTLET